MNESFKYRLSQKWWFNSTRGYTWFSFRYWWMNYLLWIALIIFLIWMLLKMTDLFSDCPEQQEVNALMRKIDRDLENCCDCKMSAPFIPTPPIDVRDSLGENEHYLPADYILITYQFDATSGKDLDTRTNVLAPFTSDILGYCKARATNGIYWSGDNTGFGVESVYIDLHYFGETDVVKVLTKAFWFSYRKSGDMSLDVRAYKGGVMEISSSDRYQFVNQGGYEVGNMLSFNKNIVTKAGCCDGEIIGAISYDRQRQVLSFE